MADLHAQVARSRTAVALVSLVVFVVGSAAVIAISSFIARPLGQMVEPPSR